MHVQPVLEAVAITAACKLRFPELKIDRNTKLIHCKATVLVLPVADAKVTWKKEDEPLFIFDPEIGQYVLIDTIRFDQATIELEQLIDSLWIGYDEMLNVVAWNYESA